VFALSLSVVSLLFFDSGDVGRYKLEGQIILWRLPTSISYFNTVKEEFQLDKSH
jgi:hypothetical protein